MRKLRLFVADVDGCHVERLERCLSECKDIVLEGRSADGREAYRYIASNHPDVLMTDVQLPGLDGLMLLKDLCQLPHPPISIICTRFYSEICVTRACRYGARYILYKPVDYRRVPEVIADCWKGSALPQASGKPSSGTQDSPADALRALLRTMGIPARVSGSVYITESLQRLCEDDGLLRNLSKGLYADIAARMNTSAASVERSLRSAITTAYARGGLNGIFPGKPTNKEFLEYLMDRMRAPQKSAASPAMQAAPAAPSYQRSL